MKIVPGKHDNFILFLKKSIYLMISYLITNQRNKCYMKNLYFLLLTVLSLTFISSNAQNPVLTIEGRQVKGVETATKGIIVYKGKYGATEQYAAWLSKELQLPAINADEVTSQWSEYDFIVMAASIYVGKWLLRDWLKERLTMLQNKKLFLFIVCATPSSERQKQEEIVKTNIPDSLIYKSGIFFLPGRLNISKLSWKDKFILKMGARLEKDPIKKAAMSHDIDGVSKEKLTDGMNAIRKFMRQKTGLSPSSQNSMVAEIVNRES